MGPKGSEHRDDSRYPTDLHGGKRSPVEAEHEVISEEEVHILPRHFISEQPSEAIVVHCYDHRFQEAFRQFLSDELRLKNWTPIVLGGSIHSFGIQHLQPKNAKVLWQHIKFLVKEGGLKRIIIINHDDCQWYEKFEGYLGSIHLPERLKKDLQGTAVKLAQDFTGASIEAYHARLEGKEVIFEKVT